MTVKMLVDRPVDGQDYKVGELCDTNDYTEAGLVAAKLATTDLTGGVAHVFPVAQVQYTPVTAVSNPLTGGIMWIRDSLSGGPMLSQLRAYIAALGQVKIAVTGDSITNQNMGVGASVSEMNRYGYMGWAQRLSRGRLMHGALMATGGANTDTISAGLDALLPTLSERIVIFFTGANDIADAPTLTPDGLYQKIRAAEKKITASGRFCILGTIFPSTTNAGADKVYLRNATNDLLRAARRRGEILLLDWSHLYQLSDGTIPTTNRTYDGVHPDVAVAFQMGVMLMDMCCEREGYVSPATWLPADKQTTYLVNGLFTGVAGTKYAGVSGDAADGWAASVSGAAGAAMVCSKVAADSFDPDPTQWQRLDITAGSVITKGHLLRNPVNGLPASVLSAYCEVEVTAPDGASVCSPYMALRSEAGGLSCFAHDGYTASAAAYMPQGTHRLMLRTPDRFRDASFVANGNTYLEVGCFVAPGKTATIKIRRCGFGPTLDAI